MTILKLASNISDIHINESYYDHVPGSASAGTLVGSVAGLGAGTAAGFGLRKMPNRIINFQKNNPNLSRNIGQVAGLAGLNLNTFNRSLKASPKKIIGLGAGIGTTVGAVDGAYKGMMTGVGMNDRQYMMERNLDPSEVVKNSTMSALQMNSTGGRLSNAYNQNFGRQVGAIRRAQMDNRKDGLIRERGIDQNPHNDNLGSAKIRRKNSLNEALNKKRFETQQ